jgi:hypothetical protein
MDEPLPARRSARARSKEGLANQEACDLLTGPPRTILERLIEGDPLGVRTRVGGRLRARWLLLDADRVHLRALALVAHRAGGWSGRPALGAWLDGQVDEAIDEVRREPATDGVFRHLAQGLGLEPGAAFGAQSAFDGRSELERRAFVRFVLDGEDLEGVARDEAVSISEIGRRARVVLDAVVAAAHSGGSS